MVRRQKLRNKNQLNLLDRSGSNGIEDLEHYSKTAVTRKTAHKKIVTADLDFK